MASDEEEEKGKGFKVEDRRRFSAEGDLKPEHRGPEAAASETKPDRGFVLSGAGTAGAAASAEGGSGPRAAADFSKYREQTPEITFETFVVGLSTQALMHLGEIPDPHSGQLGEDLVAAQQLIDIIGMLKDKTRGNVDHEEQALLDAILFELRMKYVERARRASR
jgi:hypothetical protein